MNFIKTFTADNTTAEFACESRGVTRSQMLADVDDFGRECAGIILGLMKSFANWQNIKYFLSPLGLTIITGCVIGQAVKDEYLSPLCTLIQSSQQLINGLRV